MATIVDRVRAAPRASRVMKYLRSKWFAYACVLPILIATGALVYYPLVYGIYLSMTNATDQNTGSTFLHIPASYKFVGLKNFFNIFTNNDPSVDAHGLINQTIIWIVLNAVFHFAIGLGLAMLLNRKIRFRGVYRALLILPWATPQFVAAYGWRFLFNSNDAGFVNRLLSIVHIHAINWSATSQAAMTEVIVANVWLGIPFMTITLLGGLQSIPTELYEVAAIDGASPWQRFRHVTLPLLRPIAALVTMLDVIWTFNVFVIIYLTTGGAPAHGSDTLVTYVYEIGISAGKYGIAAAYGVLILIILLVFTLVYSRLLRAGEGVA